MKHTLLGARSLRVALLLSAAAAASLLAGCSSEVQRSGASGANDGSAPDAVSVDFYAGGKVSAACAGTMLSDNVVLTSAHCADGSKGARVRIGGQTADVAKVMTYDWGTSHDRSQEHDLALLVLRTPVSASHYATVSTNACLGCNAVAHGRTASGKQQLEATSPVGRPFSLRTKGEPQGATVGGAVTGPDGALIGVYAGRGKTSSQGYVTRVDMAEVQIWMQGVVAAKGGKLQGTSGTPLVGSVKVQNTGVTGGGDGTTGGDPTSDTAGDGSDKPGAPEEDVGGPDAGGEPTDTPDGGEPTEYGGDTQDDKPGTDPPDGYRRTTGTNFWVSSRPGDPALARESQYAMNFPNATVVSTHGAPGRMIDTPDAATLRMLAMGRMGPMIVGACYAGATDGDGNRVTSSLADAAGVDRANTYGCSGTSATPAGANQMYCDGQWVDGNGRAITNAQRGTYNLRNCTIRTRNSSGGWVDYTCA